MTKYLIIFSSTQTFSWSVFFYIWWINDCLKKSGYKKWARFLNKFLNNVEHLWQLVLLLQHCCWTRWRVLKLSLFTTMKCVITRGRKRHDRNEAKLVRRDIHQLTKSRDATLRPLATSYTCSPPTSVGPPELLHAVPHQDDARQLREGLDDVEVAQGAHFEKRHAVLLGVRPRLLGGDLPFESQMESVAYKDPRNAWGMLGGRNGTGLINALLRPSTCSADIEAYKTSRTEANWVAEYYWIIFLEIPENVWINIQGANKMWSQQLIPWLRWRSGAKLGCYVHTKWPGGGLLLIQQAGGGRSL